MRRRLNPGVVKELRAALRRIDQSEKVTSLRRTVDEAQAMAYDLWHDSIWPCTWGVIETGVREALDELTPSQRLLVLLTLAREAAHDTEAQVKAAR